VEWSFLEAMMKKMGFCTTWVELIMKCVTTVKYQIKVNGEFTQQFTPTRGLRQGDPLSPYLFVICAEGLSTLLHDAEINGRISGVKIYPTAPAVTHLQMIQYFLSKLMRRRLWLFVKFLICTRIVLDNVSTPRNRPLCSVRIQVRFKRIW
jgi:hypothetical protein